jgi:cation diffusion facilitator CzcD-associated flavoprotein CzcO
MIERDRKVESVDAVVVGAGFAGLYMLHVLRQSGLKVRGFERGGDVGGTWYWNRYPGARCDSESPYYSYSFDEQLEQEWPLLERYPVQPQILSYLRHVADRFDLRQDIQFDTRVTEVVYRDGEERWQVSTDQSHQVSTRFVITAVGCLSSANKPQLPGQERFLGRTYHTGEWPHEPIDFTGKRVGLIGTGSTGIQAIPVVAEQALHLTVFQRTAQFTLPAQNHPLDPEFVQDLKANYRELRSKCKESATGAPYAPTEALALDVDDATRRAAYEAAWDVGGGRFLGTYRDLLISEKANQTAADFVRAKIAEIVMDPETARKLMPTTYPIGTKRIPIDSGYYEAYNRDNVALVDLRETPIVEVTEKGIRTTEGERELDILIHATGFDAFTGSLLALNIAGRNGVKLADKWQDGPRSYLGVAVAGFPNLFTITGPGSPSVLSNMPVSIEQHVEWIGRLVNHLVEEGAGYAEATVEAEEAWTEHVAAVANTTLYPKAASWYMGANIDGKVRMFLPYIGGVGRYRQICDGIAAGDYRGFRIPGHPVVTEVQFGAASRYSTEPASPAPATVAS